MKPRDKGGVVDARLNVYGVKGLKVAGEYIHFLAYRSEWRPRFVDRPFQRRKRMLSYCFLPFRIC